jgi:hypothetical protein
MSVRASDVINNCNKIYVVCSVRSVKFIFSYVFIIRIFLMIKLLRCSSWGNFAKTQQIARISVYFCLCLLVIEDNHAIVEQNISFVVTVIDIQV